MYTEVLRSIDGIAIFPVVSLVVFVTFLTVMLVWTSRLEANALRDYAGMPLDADNTGTRTEGDDRDREEA
jgi:hypothetical protein